MVIMIGWTRKVACKVSKSFDKPGTGKEKCISLGMPVIMVRFRFA
jgi:hypothetical protein